MLKGFMSQLINHNRIHHEEQADRYRDGYNRSTIDINCQAIQKCRRSGRDFSQKNPDQNT
jgi:hypothetical protein